MGAVLAPVLPNLPRKQAMLAGTIGGALGALLGLILGPLFGSTLGVALADALKGAALGLSLSASERLQAISSAALLIHWGRGETSLVLLGEEPILIGNTPQCRVHVRGSGDGSPCVLAKVSIASGRILVHHARSQRAQQVLDGERFTIGGVCVEVRADRRARRRAT
jgi:Ca-activated chloride channel family protein